jgi:thioredoxin-like negative regulator of GroEL
MRPAFFGSAKRVALVLLAQVFSACGSPAPAATGAESPQQATTVPSADVAERPAPVSSTPGGATASTSTAVPALAFSKDDFSGAIARASERGKLVFVDAWAEWCHTCLSMDSVVLSDPSLRPFAGQYEFVAIDTEKPQNADFVSRYEMDTWPTFFVVRPSDLELVGFWPGAASVREMNEFLGQSLDAATAMQGGTLPPHLSHFLAARRAHAQAEDAQAAAEYGKAYDSMPADWPRKGELYMGYIDALAKTRNFKRCAEVGRAHLDDVTGAAKPAQFAQRYFTCLGQLRTADRDSEVERALAKIRSVASAPGSEMAFDDRVDALSLLATAYAVMGKKREAAATLAERLRLAEEAASKAKDALEARAFDRVRVQAYMDLGQPEKALALLEQSERDYPHGYTTPALLSEVLVRLGRVEEGLAALDRAIGNSEGPRRCDYLEDKAKQLKVLGRREEELATLEMLIAERSRLSGATQRQKLEQAKQRRDRLKAALGG